MASFLRIIRQPYEEPHHVNLIVSAGNGSAQGEIEIYANASDLSDAAAALAGFPKTDNDTFVWELGSERERDRFAFYFRLRVFQVSASGRCAVEVRFNNNQQPPDQQVDEFCIPAYPADLDRLGASFAAFSRLNSRQLDWIVDSTH
jgi:hypothetical protein